ncbi:S-layer family protein [Natranaerovirga hydrolytica]|uniref:S-layer family protein n=1 Tax=Natranaerovirga hydrolytica TaxID=680378 RepID=A0A4R1MLE8_9FIRM|nr:S-layer homology domain-containing protein [Natranaerovirga hydrolytica]TCK93345.1 S-layer family protein [Natranaerovirga hydrolytica]
MRRKMGVLLIILLFINNTLVFGAEGEAGFFGGISEGVNLPREIDQYMNNQGTTTLDYKEIVFISGEPVEFEGTITINKGNMGNNERGSYNESINIEAINPQTDEAMNKSIQLLTSYRVVEKEFGTHIIRNSAVTSWNETINVEGTAYTLNPSSTFSKTSVEDITPGISYYSTDLRYHAIYDADNNDRIVVDAYNNIYGYNQTWSKIETQSMNQSIAAYSGNEELWQMNVNVNPVIEAKKSIYATESSPNPISFRETYTQRLERNSSLTYNIATNHNHLTQQQMNNSATIETANDIEYLTLPPQELSFLTGHWAEEDIKQLYSLEILDNLPHQNMLYQSMTRGEYIKLLCKTMNLDISEHEDAEEGDLQVFDDVPPNNPLYPYIMTAYDHKLTKGIAVNTFGIHQPITREEAFVIYMRIIGLDNIATTDNPRTPFVDNDEIASWAIKEIEAGRVLGIIHGDSNGRVNAKSYISAVEAGSLINRFIDYLRSGLVDDFIGPR